MLSRLSGFQIAVLSALTFSLMAFSINQVPKEQNAFGILFVRSLFISTVLLPWGIRLSPNMFSKASIVLWIRALAGVGSMLCFYWNLTQISVTHSFLFGNFTPILVIFLAWFFLKEKMTVIQIIGILITVTSVMLPRLLGINLDQYETIHWVVGILGASSLAIASTSLRKASKDFHPAVIVFWMTTVGIVFSTGIMVYRGEWISQLQLIPNHLELLGVICCLSILGQFTRTISYEKLPAPIATTLGTLTLIFGMILEFSFTSVEIDPFEIVCVLSALFGIFITQYTNWRKKS